MTEKHETNKKSSKDFNLSFYGGIIFGVGMLIVLAAPFLNLTGTTQKFTIGVLVLLGIVIGILNVTNDEAISFLIASIALVVLMGPFLGSLNQTIITSPTVMTALGKFFTYLVVLLVPAAIVVALKTLFITAKDE